MTRHDYIAMTTTFNRGSNLAYAIMDNMARADMNLAETLISRAENAMISISDNELSPLRESRAADRFWTAMNRLAAMTAHYLHRTTDIPYLAA